MRFLILALVTVFLIFLLQFNVIAQKRGAIDSPTNCEAMTANLDGVALLLNKAEPESFLILIARTHLSGTSKYDKRRIEQVKRYLGRFHSVASSRLIYAFIPANDRLSSLKFYISGRFVAEIKTVTKGKLCNGTNDPL